jgi:AraC family transcriptional activator of mtrCDE
MVLTTSDTAMVHTDLDALLLTSLRVESSLFHLGQYCGSSWATSAQGHRRSSYHLVLHGHCRVELAGRIESPLTLRAGDGIFFLRDIPHTLLPQKGDSVSTVSGSSTMQSLQPAQPDSTGLACGFFRFPVTLGETLTKTLPDWLLLRADDDRVRQARSVFQLIVDETGSEPAPSPMLLERLTDLLVFLFCDGR